jgi:hypothetical protein
VAVLLRVVHLLHLKVVLVLLPLLLKGVNLQQTHKQTCRD